MGDACALWGPYVVPGKHLQHQAAPSPVTHALMNTISLGRCGQGGRVAAAAAIIGDPLPPTIQHPEVRLVGSQVGSQGRRKRRKIGGLHLTFQVGVNEWRRRHGAAGSATNLLAVLVGKYLWEEVVCTYDGWPYPVPYNPHAS